MTRGGSKAIIFAYSVGQPRPWLGAYLLEGQYIPMSWLGDGTFIADEKRLADIPPLAEKEKQLGYSKDK